jgi:threonylcarbamoyladenosine tRNA methylthiotransferase MtaB
MRIFLDSLGCRLNQSEMESLARQLARRGSRIVKTPAAADACVLNTCAVTGEAERKSRRRARQIYRVNPRALIVLTGCYATLAPRESALLPGSPWIVRNDAKEHLAELLQPDPHTTDGIPVARLPGSRTRAFVKVQDGCDNRCAFCVTTIARGPGISRPVADVIAEIQTLESAGYQEVILTGVQLGSYGRNGNGSRLRDLVQTILRHTGIPRIRLSSLEPWDLKESMFELWADARLCRQLHLPLQSGSASILRRMARPTTPEEYRQVARAALELIPDLALTTDLMVGFPGETDADFQASMALVQELDFARLHVFRFSPRPGTAAARMDGTVPHAVVRGRSRALRQLALEKQTRYLERFVDRTLPVLWESVAGQENGRNRWQGHTGNYILVTSDSSEHLRNTITPTRLTRVRGDHMEGRVQLESGHHG